MRYSWANQLAHLGRRDEAMALFEQAIATLTQQLGAEHPATLRGIALQSAAAALP
jgi:hypothetical protein